jgi:hypothetical protein
MEAASPTFAADSPHFTIRFLSFVIIVSLSHFLTAPDDTSNSDRAVIRIGTRV